MLPREPNIGEKSTKCIYYNSALGKTERRYKQIAYMCIFMLCVYVLPRSPYKSVNTGHLSYVEWRVELDWGEGWLIFKHLCIVDPFRKKTVNAGKWLKKFKICICVNTYMEKVMATHSSTLAWKIPWTEEPDRLQSMGS